MKTTIAIAVLVNILLQIHTRVLAQTTDLSGTWIGSGTLTNDWSDADSPAIRLQCNYTGKAEPPAITLTLGESVSLNVLALSMPAQNRSCPPLRKRYQVRAIIDGTRVRFIDPAGDRWELNLTDDLLSGTVTWAPNPDLSGEALFVGADFVYSRPLRPWDVPLTRLFGKVALRKSP
jgi:hypothetical protein